MHSKLLAMVVTSAHNITLGRLFLFLDVGSDFFHKNIGNVSVEL